MCVKFDTLGSEQGLSLLFSYTYRVLHATLMQKFSVTTQIHCYRVLTSYLSSKSSEGVRIVVYVIDSIVVTSHRGPYRGRGTGSPTSARQVPGHPTPPHKK